MARILGIDPGAHGAVALLVNGRLESVAPMPATPVRNKARVDAAALAELIRRAAPDHAVLEQVASRPQQGVASMFAFGQAYGIVLGVLGAFMVPVTTVTPTEWKTALRVPAAKGEARARASQLLPDGATLWPLAKDDGKAEAAMLALWYQMKSQNQIQW
jgi:Holliday junction resolvasome RuvABC endonuclease subunit